MSKVYLSITLYNGRPYLPDLFQSIDEQTFKNFETIVVDNASTDRGADWVRQQYPKTAVLRNHKNVGFAKAQNQAIELAIKMGGAGRDNYFLVVNQDMVLDQRFLEEIVDVADRYREFGAFGGKVLKLFKDIDEGSPEKSTTIDTTGLVIKKSRRVIDRGMGETDEGQYEKMEPVFGISGALVLYRMSDLVRANVNDEYFDSAYFMYKEDVDMAWRMNNIGIQSLYVPRATAYHYRGAYRAAQSEWQIFKAIFSDTRSAVINRLSYRNHWLTILKNDRWPIFLLHSPWILVEELKRFLRYLLFLDFQTILAGYSALLVLPRIRAWRREIKKKGLAPTAQLRTLFK